MIKLNLLSASRAIALLAFIILFGQPLFAQDPKGMVIGGLTLDNSAILELNALDRGFLLPRLTTDQRNNILNPAAGLLLYNTEQGKLNLRNNDRWESIGKWSENSSDNSKIYYSGGNVGIGTDNPKSRLHVNGGYYGYGDMQLYPIQGEGNNGNAFISASYQNAPEAPDFQLGYDFAPGVLALGIRNGDQELYPIQIKRSSGQVVIDPNISTLGTLGKNPALFIWGGMRALGRSQFGSFESISTQIPDTILLKVHAAGQFGFKSAAYFESTSFDANSTVYIYRGTNSNGGEALEILAGNAKKPGGGVWIGPSDRRLKQDIQNYESGLAAIRQIKPISYRYNGLEGTPTTERYVGVIAQELQQIAPDMVLERKGKDLETYLSVDGSAFTYMLINAVQEQQTQIEEKERQIRDQQVQIDKLQQQFDELAAIVRQLKK